MNLMKQPRSMALWKHIEGLVPKGRKCLWNAYAFATFWH